MSGPVTIQALVTGLATGAAYGLIALGFSLVWRLTSTLAFAHGDIVTGAVFVGVLAVIGTTPVALPLGVASTVALTIVTLAAGAALSTGVYAVSVRPFRRDVLGWVAGGQVWLTREWTTRRDRHVKLYRINKVAEPGGEVLKKKDVLAASDSEALRRAEESPDCPTCEVLLNGKPVGSIVEKPR